MVPDEAPRPHEAADFPATGVNSLASFVQRGTARGIDAAIPLIPVVAILMAMALERHVGTTSLPAVARVRRHRHRGRVLRDHVRGVAGPDARQDAARRAGRLGSSMGPSPTRRSRPCARSCRRRRCRCRASSASRLYLVVLLLAVPDELRRGLHDQAGGTVVVRSR